MGFRFRKSFKIAPGVRFNLRSKSSSLAFGGKGFRYSVSSSGCRTATVGIPGTGISYSTTSGRKKPSSTARSQRNYRNAPTPPINPKPPIYKRKWFIILWLILFPPLGIFLFLKFWPCSRTIQIPVVAVSAIWFLFALIIGGNESEPSTPAESSLLPESSVASLIEESSEAVEEASQGIPAEESSAAESSETETSALLPEESEASSIPEESSEDAAPSESVTESVPPTEAAELSSEPAAEMNPQIVYWGESGAKYHIDPHCRSFKGTAANSGTLEQAKAAGREDWCGICSKGWTDERLLNNGNPYAE